MGTNYYLTKDVCVHCGRGDERKHIGKSSSGWCFSLHVYPEDGIRDLKDWKPLFRKSKTQIENEYGEKISMDQMIEVITRREGMPKKKPPAGYYSLKEFHSKNHAVKGPNNLLRSELNQYCISHGAGTWDCLVGEFS